MYWYKPSTCDNHLREESPSHGPERGKSFLPFLSSFLCFLSLLPSFLHSLFSFFLLLSFLQKMFIYLKGACAHTHTYRGREREICYPLGHSPHGIQCWTRLKCSLALHTVFYMNDGYLVLPTMH